MSQTDARIAAHVASFKDMPDAKFIRAAISGARYLDKQSRALAREALRRFDNLSCSPPFVAILCNEAQEPHDEIKLTVCHETVIRNKMKYRLIEFSRDGACYHWCGYDPISTPTITA